MKAIRNTFLIIAILISLFSTSFARDSMDKKILILASYHQGFTWSDDVISGILKELKEFSDDHKIYIEYMDTRRFYDDKQFESRLVDLYAYKYRNIQFDLIISVDDNAYQFLLKQQQSLFKDTPVVFSGVNFFDHAQLKNKGNFTGVAEKLDVKGTIDLMIQVLSGLKKISIISDKSSFGKMQTQLIKQDLLNYKDKDIQFEILDDLSLAEFKTKAKQSNSQSAILYVVIVKDRNGIPFNPSEYLPEITKSSSVPVFSVDENLLPYGIIGGSLKSGLVHGIETAQIAKLILSGEQASNIPVVIKPKFLSKFRYDLLRKHNVEIEKLPKGSIIVGKPFSFYETYKELVWSAGLVVAVLVILITFLVYNISNRRNTERKLRNSEVKYRNMMESFADPLYICSADLTVQYMNPAMIRHVSRDATGEKCYSVYHGLAAQCDGCIFDKVASGNTIETNIKSPLDDRNYSITNMPIHNPDNTISKMTIFRDITDYLQAVKDKEKAQDQLLRSQKMESIGNLAGGIAHDFNNILSAIIGFSELALEETTKGTSIEDSLQEVYLAANRAKDLVKQILAFARQSDEEKSPIEPSRVVKEVLKFIRSTIPSTIEIRHNIEDTSWITGNATQLHQVLTNICTNAAQAMEDAGGVLHVSLKDSGIDDQEMPIGIRQEDYVEIKVSDTGVGIADDVIGSIFEPYYTTKRPGEGTGLGLAMAHGVIESYGGSITVDSELGEGTTFSIYLPITNKQTTEHDRDLEPLPSGSEHILFVDDEQPIVKMGIKMLERLGYKVTARTRSIEALELFKEKPSEFDLVITDMTMPELTGDKLAIELMKIRHDIPVILCTGFSKKISEKTATELGIKAFAYKPLVKADLAKVVRRVSEEANSGVRLDRD